MPSSKCAWASSGLYFTSLWRFNNSGSLELLLPLAPNQLAACTKNTTTSANLEGIILSVGQSGFWLLLGMRREKGTVAMGDDGLLINYHDACVYPADVELFSYPNWLNDNCINFYLRHLENSKYLALKDAILLMDPAVVSCMMIQCTDEEDLTDLANGLEVGRKRAIFVPVNDSLNFFSGNTHWSLLVYLAEDNVFAHFDSHGTSNLSCARSTAVKLAAMLGIQGKPTVVSVATPQQENCSDCGVYVLANADYLLSRLQDGLSLPLDDDGKGLFSAAVNASTVTVLRQELPLIVRQVCAAELKEEE